MSDLDNDHEKPAEDRGAETFAERVICNLESSAEALRTVIKAGHNSGPSVSGE